MATERQKKVAKLIVENATLDKPLNKGEILERVRYGKVSKQPSRVFESQGVKDALEELGFNEHSAMKVVQEIMLSKEADPNARLKATDQVFKVHGSYAPVKVKQSGTILTGDISELDNGQLEAILSGTD